MDDQDDNLFVDFLILTAPLWVPLLLLALIWSFFVEACKWLAEVVPPMASSLWEQYPVPVCLGLGLVGIVILANLPKIVRVAGRLFLFLLTICLRVLILIGILLLIQMIYTRCF